MKSIFAGILLTILYSCASPSFKDNTLILKYEEFGPPALANDLIGMDWWQWQSHGDSRPKKYDIKVVVYKDIDLKKVKIKYAVSRKDQQDFRYVEYKKAINYLDKAINENVIKELTQKLINTKNKIQSTLNDSSK